jgi:hypothetical protein
MSYCQLFGPAVEQLLQGMTETKDKCLGRRSLYQQGLAKMYNIPLVLV